MFSILQKLLQDMEDSQTVLMSYHANDPNVGMPLHQDKGRYKMFLCDTGLFITLAFWDAAYTENVIYEKLLGDKLSADLGYVFENAVAQMLKASGNELFYYTWPTDTGKHNYEIDFLLSRQGKICPLEVKSSTNYSASSLGEFSRMYKRRISESYIIHPKNLSVTVEVTKIPPYMFFAAF